MTTVKLTVDGHEVPLEDLTVVGLEPGDLVLVRVSDRFTPSQMRELRDWLRGWAFPDHEVVVLPAESVSLLRPTQGDTVV